MNILLKFIIQWSVIMLFSFACPIKKTIIPIGNSDELENMAKNDSSFTKKMPKEKA